MIRLLCVLAMMFLGSVVNAQCPGGVCYRPAPQPVPQYHSAVYYQPVYYQPMYYIPPVHQQPVIQYPQPQQVWVTQPVIQRPPVQLILYLPY